MISTIISFLTSPFKLPKLRWYFGKIAVGTPIFFPRKWVKSKDKPGHLVAIPKKIGFDLVKLGWKTKWSDDDYRFEWEPCISFVFFGYQIAVTVVAPIDCDAIYWETWLFYEYSTDKSLSKKERIEDCKKRFPQTVTVYKVREKKQIVNYYNEILKPQYL